MNESRVEAMLEQMSLKRPSGELDGRVAGLLPRAVAVHSSSSVHERSSSVGWKVVSAVAAACLVVGVSVGRMTVPKATAAVTWAPLAESIDANLQGGDAKVVLASFQGPPVATLCSMSGQTMNGQMQTDRTMHATEEVRCSKCHLGVTEPAHEPSFNHGVAHVHNFHRQLCSRCHVTTEDWNADTFSDTFLGHPFKVKLNKSPTG